MKKIIVIAALLLFGAAVPTAAAAVRPQNTVAPSISGTARQGEMLTADPGTWTGTQPITFSYQWRRCDSNGASCANIVGATGRQYTLTSADVANTLRIRVAARNSAGSRAVVSAPSSVIAAKPATTVVLDSNRTLVVYGGSVTLSGSVSSGLAGESVTIVERRFAFSRTGQVREVMTVTTQTGGSFTATLKPTARTIYVARLGVSQSEAVGVAVRPRLQLLRTGSHRFMLRAFAARSLVGKYGVIQRWNRRAHVWVGIRRVFLRGAVSGVSPTVVSTARFRVRLGGVRIRVFMPLSQTVPGYVSGTSNARIA